MLQFLPGIEEISELAIEIEEIEERSSEKSAKFENCNSSPCRSETEVTIESNEDSPKNTLITEKIIIDHNKQLEKRVQHLKTTLEALRKRLQDEKEMWKKELEEFETLQSAEYENSSNMSSVSAENAIEVQSAIQAIENDATYQHKQESLYKIQTAEKINLWRTLAMAEYQRRLLEVESMCNLEMIRVKQSVQSLQPLQKIMTEWNSDQAAPEKNTDDFCSSKSTTTIIIDENLENKDVLEGENDIAKEENEEEILEKETEVVPIKESTTKSATASSSASVSVSPSATPTAVTPRSKIFQDFTDVCGKMQSFMMNIPMATTVAYKTSSDTNKTQTAILYSALTLN